jgi:hypothetical protein
VFSDLSESDINLRADENLQLVIRAHLYAEQLLYGMLTEGLQHPAAIDLDRLTFLTKARLAAAMGLMHPEVVPALAGLNSLRNNFAHKFDYQFTDQDKAALLNTIPPHVVQVIMTDSDGSRLYTREDVPPERVLKVLVCLMEARRRHVVRSKKQMQDAERDLREALDSSKRTLEKSRAFRESLGTPSSPPTA